MKMSNKVWDQISYAQSEAVNHVQKQIELVCNGEEERKRALEWWMTVSRPVKCEPEVEKYNRKCSCFCQDFGEDDA